MTTVAALGAALALAEIAEFDDVDTSIVMLRMRGGALAQLDNTGAPATATTSALACLARRGVIESGSQASRGVTLWQERAAFSPDSIRLVQSRRGSYYAHLDAFVRSLGGEAVPDCRGCWTGCGRRLSPKPPCFPAARAVCQRRTAGVRKARMRSAYGATARR